jgi:uroporphyrinogen decarboxylase
MLLCYYREYLEIKQMMYKDPKLLHHILGSLAGSIGDYANYQIESGAQVRMSTLT